MTIKMQNANGQTYVYVLVWIAHYYINCHQAMHLASSALHTYTHGFYFKFYCRCNNFVFKHTIIPRVGLQSKVMICMKGMKLAVANTNAHVCLGMW